MGRVPGGAGDHPVRRLDLGSGFRAGRLDGEESLEARAKFISKNGYEIVRCDEE